MVLFREVYDLLGEEFSSLTEIRVGSRMVSRLTEERGGGRGREKTQIRNEGIEVAGGFKKNGPILYFPSNDYLLLISPPPPGAKKTAALAVFLLIVARRQDVLTRQFQPTLYKSIMLSST